ncbi:MAG: GatB/YqeY domain-containing protein [Clostridia bacterium]|nr:GatB/YqeY domain-containing protein [Clostridia bacterium]
MWKEKLLEDLKSAMKDKDVVKKNTVQMVRAAVLQVEKDKQIELNDDQILEVIAKEFKKRNDSLADYEKSGREDLISQIKEEMAVLEGYLPKKLSEEELTEKVKEIVSEIGATSMKDMGIIMKTAKERLGVTADGRMINEVVKKLLA